MSDSYHPDIFLALKEKRYKDICSHLHTNHYESDSEWTVMRCNVSFIEGFKEAEKYFEPELLRLKTIADIYQVAAEGKDIRPIRALNAFSKLDEKQKKLILDMSAAMLAVQRNGGSNGL